MQERGNNLLVTQSSRHPYSGETWTREEFQTPILRRDMDPRSAHPSLDRQVPAMS